MNGILDLSAKVNLGNYANGFLERMQTLYTFSSVAWGTLVIISIVLVASTIVAGFVNRSRLAGFLSIGSATVLALQSAFALDETATFYRQLRAEAELLAIRVAAAQSADDLASVRKAYEDLLRKEATSAPRGAGFAAANSIQPPSK